MLILFPAGAERTLARAARAALEASLDAAERMARLNAERRAAGKPEIRFGTGLAAGEVVYGNVGAPDRLDFTVMGVAVNRAARLEALTKDIGAEILMGPEVAAHAARPVRALGRHSLRGLREALEVYALAEAVEPRSQTAPAPLTHNRSSLTEGL
jgi:adenylate cyclase